MSDFKKGDTASWDSEQVRRSQPAPKRTARPRKRRRRRINPFVYILLVLLISALLAGVGWLLACDLCAFNRGAIEEVTVEVTAEDSMGDVADKLQEDAGLIRYKWFFRLFAAVTGASEEQASARRAEHRHGLPRPDRWDAQLLRQPERGDGDRQHSEASTVRCTIALLAEKGRQHGGGPDRGRSDRLPDYDFIDNESGGPEPTGGLPLFRTPMSSMGHNPRTP